MLNFYSIIYKAKEKENIILTAKRLADEGAVSEFDVTEISDEKRAEFSACIKDGSEVYYVKAAFKNNLPLKFSCSCSQNDGVICAHLAAAALYGSRLEKAKTNNFQQPSDAKATAAAPLAAGTLPPRKTHSILRKFKETEISEAIEKIQSKVDLIPVLEFDGQALLLKLKIGRERPYHIRNLKDFFDRIAKNEEYSYGEMLKVRHFTGMFSEQSRDFFSLLNICCNRSGTFTSRNFSDNVSLTGELLDRLFFMFYDESSKIQGLFRENNDIIITKEYTKIKYGVYESDNKFIFSRGEKNITLLKGLEYSYTFYNNTLTRLDRDFPRGALILFDYGGSFTLEKEDFTEFISKVYPVASACFEFEMPDIEIENYKTDAPVYVISLDVNEGQIAAVCEAEISGKKVRVLNNFIKSEYLYDIAVEMAVESVLKEYFTYSYNKDLLLIQSEENEFLFLHAGLEKLKELARIVSTDEFNKYKVLTPPAADFEIKTKNNALDVAVNFSQKFPQKDLKAMVAAYNDNKPYIKLDDYTFVNTMESEEMRRLNFVYEGLEDKIFKQNFTLPFYRAFFFAQGSAKYGLRYGADKKFEDIINNVRDYGESKLAVGKEFEKQLRSYQKSGFKWLKTLAVSGFGGILADDMGLGKTFQTIAFIKSFVNSKTIIVCPSSLTLNWINEFEKFAPGTRTVNISGDKDRRGDLINDDCEVMVISYDLLRREIENLEKINFDIAIIDEAQYIKNHATKNAQAVKALNAKHRFALTGTPIENNVSELWSIFDFVMPGYLYNYSKFKTVLESKIDKAEADASEKLRNMVAPFILRRIKKEVLSELPPKTESVIQIELADNQKNFYNETKDRLKKSLKESENKIEILAGLTRLRQICCHPLLFSENYEGNSAKLDAVMDILCNSGGQKTLIFSQFTSMLAILASKLREENISYYLLQGDTKPEERIRLVDNFNGDDTQVFLISLKAGGTGLNLTGAEVVIHYDPWWNLSVQNQATDRAHRFGQKKAVQVYKLVMKDTIEDKIIEMQNKKMQLFDDIIREGEIDITKLSKEDIINLM